MSYGNFVRAIENFGVIETARKFYMMKTLKFGALVGVDKCGNKYYENAVEYPHGQHRWVEFPGFRPFTSVDASEVPAEWHGWLHGVTDDVPTESSTGSTGRQLPEQIVKHTDAPFQRNLGTHSGDHTKNLTNNKPRGYGLGNNIYSLPNDEKFWTQPGNPLDARFRHRKMMENHTLMDTPATLVARQAQAAAAGSLAAYASAQRRALLTAGQEAAAATTGTSPRGTFAISEEVLEQKLAESRAATIQNSPARSEDVIFQEIHRLENIIAKYASIKEFSEVDDGLAEARARLEACRKELAGL